MVVGTTGEFSASLGFSRGFDITQIPHVTFSQISDFLKEGTSGSTQSYSDRDLFVTLEEIID